MTAGIDRGAGTGTGNSTRRCTALTQAHWHPDAKAMIAPRKAGGGEGLEAMRILKRRLSDVIYDAMLNDARTQLEAAA